MVGEVEMLCDESVCFFLFFFFLFFVFFFFFKQKTAYEIVSRDWSSDVCSSDLVENDSRKLAVRY